MGPLATCGAEPRSPGDRVKTDKRDARKLARAYRSGDLTPVFVPDAEHEALRDLVRAREAVKKDETRANRLTKFLLRYALRPKQGVKAWSLPWWAWLKKLSLEHPAQNTTLLELILEVEHQRDRVTRLDQALDAAIEHAPKRMRDLVKALQSLRGVQKLTAVTLATEVGSFERFDNAKKVMGYTGLIPSEHSSGDRRRQGAITRTGNTHLRRVLVEAAHHYRHRPNLSRRQRLQKDSLDPRIVATAWKAQRRLYTRYWKMTHQKKPAGKVVTAIARELIAFIWDIGRQAEALSRADAIAA